jgi:hypothetical protein
MPHRVVLEVKTFSTERSTKKPTGRVKLAI